MVHTTLPNSLREKEGGVTMHVHRLSNRLVQAGHQVVVFSADPRPADAAYSVEPLRGPAWAASSFLGRGFVLPWLLYRLPLEDFDVIHTHGDDAFFIHPKRLRSLHGSALGELRSATRLRRRVGQGVLYPLEVLAAAGATRAAAQSAATGRDFPFVHDRLDYAVDTDLFTPGPKSEQPSVLFVGTMEGRKRGRLLVEAFAAVRALLPTAELWMVAGSEVRGPGIVSQPKLDEEAMASLYRSAWTFCLPSTYEGFGLPYLEAFASGTAVVGTTNPGLMELSRDGRDALVVDADDLASGLLRVLTDPAKREELAGLGLTRAADYSWDRVVAQHESLYRLVAAT